MLTTLAWLDRIRKGEAAVSSYDTERSSSSSLSTEKQMLRKNNSSAMKNRVVSAVEASRTFVVHEARI